MKRLLTKSLLLGLFLISCNDHTTEIIKQKPPKIAFTNLVNEALLNSAIGQIGLSKTGSKSGRIMAGLTEFKPDSILKVLQSDSAHYTYTLYLQGESKTNSFKNLVFKRVAGGFVAFVLEYTSSTVFLDISSFTGTVKKYDLEGTLLLEVPLNKVSLGKASQGGRTQACFADTQTECIEWFQPKNQYAVICVGWATVLEITCSGGSGGSTGTAPTPNPGGTYIPDPNPLPPGGSGGSPSPSGPSTPSQPTNPPAGDPSFEGSDPIGVLPLKPNIQAMINNWEEEQIFDSQLKPCMQTILSDLKNLTQGSVGQIIKKFSGTVPGYNWEVKDGVLVGGQNAFTDQVYNKSTGTVTTTFDASKFTNSSDLSIARTILHESIHTSLVAHFKIDPLGAIKSYPDLVNDWAKGIYGDQNTNQHAEFVRNFVNDLAIALEEYGIAKGYNLPNQFYQDLAWGGLTHTGKLDSAGMPIETPWFQSSFPNSSDRQRIINVITIEQTGKDFYGNSKTKNGKNAGC